MALPRISKPVGTRSKSSVINETEDVQAIQTLLKIAAHRLGRPQFNPGKIDGRIAAQSATSATVQAIKAFQKDYVKMPAPNGVVDPGEETLRSLVQAANVGDIRLHIARFEYSTESIIGRLYLSNKLLCFTLELPWRDNKEDVSCVRAGLYSAYLRYDSPSSKREWCPELSQVPGRSHIQIHIANEPHEISGCTAVGLTYAQNIVHSSEPAFTKLQDHIFAPGLTRRGIRLARPEHGIFTVQYQDNELLHYPKWRLA